MGILLKFVKKLICAIYFAGVFFAITLIMTTVITLLEAVITRMYRTARPLPSILKMPTSIVGKKWDPGILDPSRFSAQIRKVEARLGKLAKIRKVETN